MKKVILSLSMTAIFASTVVAASLAIEHEHHCGYRNCPYQGKFEWAIPYTKGTDAYCIDKLHFEHPDATYDQLEELMWGERTADQWYKSQGITYAE